MFSFPGLIRIGFLFILFFTFSCRQASNEDRNSISGNNSDGKNIPESNDKTGESATQLEKNTPLAPDNEMEADTILGPWIRPDGNYILEFTKINDDKSLETHYYNPKPIHVSLAQIKLEDRIRIYVEFDDENYRGSYYDLEYDPVNDALTGNYFQATYGQTYAIAFIRYIRPD